MKYDIKKILPFSSIIIKASGRFGDYVFYMRYGHICARKYIIPPNPRTDAQQKGRNLFAETVKEWQNLDEATKERWNEAAKSLGKHGCSLFIGVRMKERLRECLETCVPELPKTNRRRRERVLRTGGWSTNVMNSFTLSEPHRLFNSS